MKLRLETKETACDIIVERGILSEAGRLLDLKRKVLVVTDSKVPAEYSEAVCRSCRLSGGTPYLMVIPQGEKSKNLRVFEDICRRLLEEGFNRNDCIAAVGGGVTGDLSGFAAACYMRGIDFYNIPTTLLSQVDSSIGGKTAVDFEGVKNIIGAFHQPKGVLIDPDVLKTLDERQLACGCAEIIKMAVTFDAELFDDIEKNGIMSDVEKYISRALGIKAGVVEADEKENGLRKALNYGHTLGHGIESNSELYHGEAVALGMLPMCEDKELRSRLTSVIKNHNLPVDTAADVKKVVADAMHDKKSIDDKVVTVKLIKAGSFRFEVMTADELEKKYLEVFG